MLDGLLGRSGFSSKCKSLIKPTRTRIEVLRRRAEAKQRFLKEDLGKLLANGLDVNAYGRTEEFIAGLNTLSCYTFIDQSCDYILKQLSIMQKLGHCPEECRETVASLMFAAARFSDLPELRDLRDVFQERYGNGLECFVNQVFVEKIASEPPVVDKRIKLLQDIAAEISIQWDSKGFRQRMDKPSALAQDQAEKPGSLSVTDDKYKLPNGNNFFSKNDQRSKERMEHAQDRPRLHNDGNVNIKKKEVLDIPFVKREEKRFKERIEHTHEGAVLQNDRNVNVRRNEDLNIPNVRREEKRSKERIEHAHEGLMLHERNGNGNGNGSVRMKEVLDIPFVGRDEKRGYKHEERISKLENGGYFSKPWQENDSENNGFGRYDTPVMMKTSGGSYHDRQPEVFNDDRAIRERKERHGYKQELVTSRPETDANGDIDDHLVRGRHEMKASRRSCDRRAENLGNDHVTAFLNGDHDDHLVRGRHTMKTSRRSRDRRPENLGNDHLTAFQNGDHDDHLLRERHEMKTSRRFCDRRPENIDNDHVTALLNRENPNLLHPGKSEGISNGTKHLVNGDEEDVLKSKKKVKEEEAIRLKSSLPPPPPPPYVKLNIPPPYSKPNNVSKPERIKDESDRVIGEDHHYHNDIPLPKPRSIRRKHSKSASSHDDIGSSEDARIVRRISSSRRKERKGLQILFDDDHYHSPKDEEEKMMDKLLLHYSKKPSAYDIGKLKKKKSRSSTSKSPSPHHGSNDEVAEMIVPPMRSLSLPNEHSGESAPKKVYARANSFQPDNQAPHVHPKLPDYDDLAARFAAMRGR